MLRKGRSKMPRQVLLRTWNVFTYLKLTCLCHPRPIKNRTYIPNLILVTSSHSSLFPLYYFLATPLYYPKVTSHFTAFYFSFLIGKVGGAVGSQTGTIFRQQQAWVFEKPHTFSWGKGIPITKAFLPQSSWQSVGTKVQGTWGTKSKGKLFLLLQQRMVMV